jgi:hypothetical protein
VISAIVPPETPGMISAIPIRPPRKKFNPKFRTLLLIIGFCPGLLIKAILSKRS